LEELLSGLLEGVRVLEYARHLNGDTVGMLLADLGADVIKVEEPTRGDFVRDTMGQIVPHVSPVHLQVNKNKRSVAIDLRAEQGVALFWQLLASADVFIDGTAGDACARIGIGYESQREHNPAIVYCQYTGFGSAGPYASLPTHGGMMEALGGSHNMVMSDDGFMHKAPRKGFGGTESGGGAAAGGAAHAALHVVAALLRRAADGNGCFIDVAGTDGLLAQAAVSCALALNEDKIVDRVGLPDMNDGEIKSARYQYYETRDGKVALLAAIEPKFWRNFCEGVERPDLIGEQGSGPVDFGDDDAVRAELQAIFATRTLAEWMEFAVARRIPLGPAYRRIQEALDDPHLASRGILRTFDHPLAGSYTCVAEPALVAGQPYELRYPAPSHGEHTTEVLRELGLSDESLSELREAGVIMSAFDAASSGGGGS
jgi:crotonobetainyl-CoA:carnitine CoA-transferase CaiB-like acyl-CoA transferase